MKKVFLSIIILTSINCFSQFSKIDTLDVDKKIRNRILDFTSNSIEICNKGKYFPLNIANAEPQMLKWYSLSAIKKSCDWMNERYGNVEKIKLEQILKSKNKNLIFRYKVYRTKADVVQEVRTFYSFRKKFYGLVNKIYWKDEYDGTNKNPVLFISSLDNISELRREELKNFAFKSYNVCGRKLMPQITEENTEYRSYRKDWVSLMLKECDSIKVKNGKLESIKLDQYLSDEIYQKVYRFKAKFKNLQKPSEVRIYCSLKDKYRGIFVIDKWFSQFLPFKEAIEKSKEN